MNQSSFQQSGTTPSLGDQSTITNSRHDQLVPFLLAASLFLVIFIGGLGLFFTMQHPWIVAYISELSREKAHTTGLIFLDSINEQPHIQAESPGENAPICDSVPERYRPALIAAFGLMRGDETGAQLYDVLTQHKVCVQLADISYNGGYATSWRTSNGRWVRGSITLDRKYIRSRQADLVAAMLVHEATHIDRAINGQSCEVTGNCEILSNGVALEEEIAAHAAEAQFWIAIYGENGKRFTFGTDYSENRLASVFEDGPSVFANYVRQLRSDPRDGKDL